MTVNRFRLLSFINCDGKGDYRESRMRVTVNVLSFQITLTENVSIESYLYDKVKCYHRG